MIGSTQVLQIVRGLLAGLCLILAGCSAVTGEVTTPVPTIQEETMMPETHTTPDIPVENGAYGPEVLYSAYDGGQIIVQGDFLRIGVGAIRPGEYTDSSGQVQSGTIAHLSFFVRGRPDLETDLTVHEGTIVTVAGYRVRVTDVDNDNQMVVVKIAEAVEHR